MDTSSSIYKGGLTRREFYDMIELYEELRDMDVSKAKARKEIFDNLFY